jgi:hypothetical protein
MKADAHRRHAESLERARRESEVQEALDLLERIRTWATTEIGGFS